MKTLIAVSLAVLVSSTAFAAPRTKPQPADLPSHFIEICSGISAPKDDISKLLAWTSCMSRIRGFADGHMATAEMVEEPAYLWCIDPKVTDERVLKAVAQWIVNNPQEYLRNVATYNAVDATYATTVEALNHSFPCKQKKNG